MNKLIFLALAVISSTAAHASEKCWKALNAQASTAESFLPTFQAEVGAKDSLATLHTDAGTIQVSKNGSCERVDKKTYADFMIERLQDRAVGHLAFKMDGDKYTRKMHSVTSHISRADYNKDRAELMQLLAECSSEAGKLGEASRAILMKFGNSLESTIQTGGGTSY